MSDQFDMFGGGPELPEGFRYRPEFVTPEEEAELAKELSELPFREFEFQGFLGKRRVVSFGWRYVFDGSGLQEAEPIPDFLLPIRDRAARFGSLAPDALEHVLLTEYSAGAAIGWHRDRPAFGEVVGISLLAPARLRFRRKQGTKWERAAVEAEPRSAYLLTGPARREWEHSIPAVESLRYSITFRTLAASRV
nr:alpha-ketoglutarate-dependent dioxygenase AlkB [uncultured Sphingosinicella sp.]